MHSIPEHILPTNSHNFIFHFGFSKQLQNVYIMLLSYSTLTEEIFKSKNIVDYVVQI